jgi:hypothetical protein
MLNTLIAKLKRFDNPMRDLNRRRDDAIEAWSLFMGRDAAELWLEALASRPSASNL